MDQGEIIEHLSHLFTLHPGNVMELEIEGLGRQKQRVVMDK